MTVYVVSTVPNDEYRGNVLFEANSPEEAIALAMKDANFKSRFIATATNIVFDKGRSDLMLKFFKGEISSSEFAEKFGDGG